MSNKDKVYVIYFGNKMFAEHGRKSAYLKESYAKEVITSESRRIAHDMFDEAKTGQCWYDIGEENKQEWLDKARNRFEIKEFVERVIPKIKPIIIDTRNEQVYCTNCKHWDRLLKCIKDESVKFTPSPCCACYPYDPEDSQKRLIRTKYEEL